MILNIPPPVLYPSWRGQNDKWEAYGLDYKTDTPLTNVAINVLTTEQIVDGAAVVEKLLCGKATAKEDD